jgi:hypothetical protein
MRYLEDGDQLRFLQGTTIERISFDYAVTLHFGDGKEIRIETDMSITTPEGEHVELCPASAGAGAEVVLRMLHKQVKEAIAEERTGDLSIELEDGTNLQVPHHDSYEAWNYDGPGGDLLVSRPGGGLAIWGMEDSGA